MTSVTWLRRGLLGSAATALLTLTPAAAMAGGLLGANAGGDGYSYSFTPVADMPAPATEVNVSGNVRALITTEKTTGGAWQDDVASRLRLYVRGKTETSVGEVGVYSRLQATGGDVDASSYYGYWKATPDLTLTGGHNDTIAAVVHGADWNATGGVWNSTAHVLTNPGVDFVSLGFGSGPFTATAAVEDNTSAFEAGDDTLAAHRPAVAGSLNFKQGDFSTQVTGRYQASDDTAEGNDGWMVGAGATYSMGMLDASLGGATGRGMAKDFTTFDLTSADALGTEFTAASALLTLHVTESTRIEGFAGWGRLNLSDGLEDAGQPEQMTGLGGGLYWSPAAQLTLGAGASYSRTAFDSLEGTHKANSNTTTAGVGAWFSF